MSRRWHPFSRPMVGSFAAALLTLTLTAQAQTPAQTLVQTPAPAPAPAATAPLSYAQAFDAALAHDAQFRAARFEREATQGAVPIARAALLPNASLNFSDARTQGTRDFPNAVGQQVSVAVDYASPQASLQVRAPIFNWESISRYRQALLQSDAADAIFRVRGGDLVERLSLAYLQRLLSAENLRLVQAQIESLQAQQLRAEERLKRGEGTRIEVAEASAQLDTVRVRALDARDQVLVARRALQRITGIDAELVRGLPSNFEAPLLVPQSLDAWLELAYARNATLQAREQQLAVARMGVQRSLAGHYPRLDAVGSVTRSSNESLANLNQKSKLGSVGLQLTIPIFSGFGVDAAVAQSRSEVAKSEAELAAEREGVTLDVQRQFLAATSGRARIAALAQAQASMELSLEGISRGVPAGLRTLAEVLDAQTRVFSARRELAQARMDYLLARTRLQTLAGAPLAEVVADVERQLGPAT